MSAARSSPTRSTATASAFALLISAACSSESDEVSYQTQIRPLFDQRRCVLCHYEATKLDLNEPFVPGNGLFVVENTWHEGHGGLEYNVVPGDPDASFLMQKVSDQSLAACDRRRDASCTLPADAPACINGEVGLFMPPQMPPATAEQIKTMRDWIAAGAEDTPEFRTRVVPIFGDLRFTERSCCHGGYADYCVTCYTCHNEDAGLTPNLVVPNFDDTSVPEAERNQAVAEWLATIVGVKSRFRADLDLVKPGDPDASFLVMKMEAREPSSAIGARMPYPIDPLSAADVDLVRRWILEGARNN